MPKVTSEELSQEDKLVLYAVNKSSNGVPTKTHYQKMMYLILKALGNDPKTGAGYVPHHYGPYSPIVDGWRDVLLGTGYLIKNTRERITINPEVKECVGRIGFPDELTGTKIDSIVKFVCSLTHEELLLFIYADDVRKKEGMTENSDVIKDIFGKRVNIALGMTRSGKVSIAKGAELADMDVTTFKNMLK